MVGSSPECDIVLKSKYVSRRQMVLVEDVKPDKIKSSDANKYQFSLICLSQTNFTVISYPYRVKAGVGLIFFGKDIKYQILSYERTES
jgi:hypothetical protein